MALQHVAADWKLRTSVATSMSNERASRDSTGSGRVASAACQYAPPAALDEFGNPLPPGDESLNPLERAGQAIRDFFGGGDPAKQVPPADAPQPRPVQ